MKKLLSILAGIVLLASALTGQTALTATTLATALDAKSQVVSFSSGTGLALGLVARVDLEFVAVEALPPTTTGITGLFRIKRGQQGTQQAAHAAGADVIMGPLSAFATFDPSGACTRTLKSYVPVVNTTSGKVWDCTAGYWSNFTDSPGVGTVIASQAGAMSGAYAILAKVTPVSGTNEITSFAIPAGLPDGGKFTIVPSAACTTATGGNIAIASTCVAGKALTFVWDRSAGLLYPSY